MAWFYLLTAGALEIFWAAFLKLSHGFTRPLFSVITILGMLASFLFLSQATKTLPLGTSYAIWTGIGAIGAVVVGVLVFKEPLTGPRILFTALLLTGILGLKLTAPQ